MVFGKPFWDAFREIALRENKTVAELVATIDRGNRGNLSSEIRIFVLDYCRRLEHPVDRFSVSEYYPAVA